MNLYLIEIESYPFGYNHIGNLQGIVLCAPCPDSALIFLNKYDVTDNKTYSPYFWYRYGKVTEVGVVPSEMDDTPRVIHQCIG